MAIDRAHQKGEPDLEEILDELAQKIERVRVLYEQYFMGIERMEPLTARKEVSRKLLEIAQLHIRNTGLRYRFNMLNQKFGVYVTYWNRTQRAIENGTYHRDVARASRAALRRGVEMPDEVLKALPPRLREKIIRERQQMAAALEKKDAAKAARAGGAGTPAKGAPAAISEADADSDIDAALDNLFGEAEAAVSKPAPKATATTTSPSPSPSRSTTTTTSTKSATAPAPKGTQALPPGVDEATAKEIHKRFVQAKKLLGQNDDVKLEQIVATIAKQGPAIIEKHKAKGVEFQVVIKDDKVILKATPKK